MADDILDQGGRVALVTGAGQGVGREIARQLARHNSGGVAVNDYHLDRAREVADAIEAEGGRAIAVQADVTELPGVKAMVAEVEAALGPVGTLVNNAGNMGIHSTADLIKPFWETNPELWARAIDVNLYGVLNCAAAVIPGMIRRQAPGRIVTIISDSARFGDANLEAYAAAKAGAAGFMRSLARSVGRYAITANSVSIATTRTPATAGAFEDAERNKRMFERYIVRRPGEPDDIAAMVAFLVSDASSWITGQTYPVNGGYTLSL